jgi:hypothetical protein
MILFFFFLFSIPVECRYLFAVTFLVSVFDHFSYSPVIFKHFTTSEVYQLYYLVLKVSYWGIVGNMILFFFLFV